MSISKKLKAFGIIQAATVTAMGAAAGMAQIPYADVPVLCGIETTMVISLGALFGKKLNETAAKGLIAAYIGKQVGASTFKAIVGVIPGVGNGLNASIAATMVETLGWAVYADFKNN